MLLRRLQPRTFEKSQTAYQTLGLLTILYFLSEIGEKTFLFLGFSIINDDGPSELVSKILQDPFLVGKVTSLQRREGHFFRFVFLVLGEKFFNRFAIKVFWVRVGHRMRK